MKLNTVDIFDRLGPLFRLNLSPSATIRAIDYNYNVMGKLHDELRAELYQSLAMHILAQRAVQPFPNEIFSAEIKQN